MSKAFFWLQSSLKRVYPNTPPAALAKMELNAARGERISFQACVHNASPVLKDVQVCIEANVALQLMIRRVGYVPMPHFSAEVDAGEIEGMGMLPGYAPDPLYPESVATLGPSETHAFWITVTIPENTPPGRYGLKIRFQAKGGEDESRTALLNVSPVINRPRKAFPVTHWFYADALCDWYGMEPLTERFWTITEIYIANLISHGNDCVYVPLFTPPTDGVKRPTQLLLVDRDINGTYSFGWEEVKRWIDMSLKQGAKYFEWTHLFSSWGAKYAIRIYRENSDAGSLLWPADTEGNSKTYRDFLAQFLPALYDFLREENILENSFFHLSDEPHGEEQLGNYRKARQFLKEVAPWLKVADALSELEYGLEGLTDIPIPSLSMFADYAEAGIPAWTYYCCVPRGKYLNRFLDTPLAKIRMSGWLFYALGVGGFLHWGYNYWYKSQTQTLINPFTEAAAEAWPMWASGDPFVVYPGPEGPIDSIRWEIFAESLQDYALLETLGVKPAEGFLRDIVSFEDFPKTQEWIAAARCRLLSSP